MYRSTDLILVIMTNSYTYILLCADDTYYVGSTKDLGFRFWQHSNGEGAEYTTERLPIKLIYVEIFTRIDKAFEREHQLKKWSRKKKEALMKNEIQKLITLAKKDFKHKSVKILNETERTEIL